MNLTQYKEELKEELGSILRYWMQFTPDYKEGGFYGRVDGENKVVPDSPKGVVLNSRILWTFSAAFSHMKEPAYRPVAQRAYEYLLAHFIDREYGGVYWSVDHQGNTENDRKQIYGLAFCLYGLSEYYLATGEPTALDESIALFRLIEQHSYDPEHKGYFEAFTRDWKPLEDLRLSEKDENVQKTTNTQLHILEAYANLHRAWPDALLQRRIAGLLGIFFNSMVRSRRMFLFFDKDWTPRSSLVSYGHDIEASWLLQDAAGKLGAIGWMEYTPGLAMVLAESAAEGLDDDGGLWYEREGDQLVREKHWWPQAEAMLGFFNAWQISGDPVWLERSMASWDFVKRFIRDREWGEWWWGVDKDHSPMPGQDKAGFWKCPYHNSRACLEIIRRLDILM
ncbi:MAG TPA: AGE family epimerase/isomerase [Puia sp.]|nr:AGE family epimerase/isomerase [Puia sp.]